MKRRMLFVFAFVLVFSACSKSKKIECAIIPEPYIAPTLFFNIIDKSTSKDLFFSQNPSYNVNQVVYFFKNWSSNGIITDTFPVRIDSTRKCLALSRPPGNIDTGFIQITNLPIDTLVFGVIRGLQINPCYSMSYIDSLIFDKADYVADANQIITVKK